METLNHLYAVINKDAQPLGVNTSEHGFAVALFEYLEDAERYVIQWGQDPDEHEFCKFETAEEILWAFEELVKTDHPVAIISPPARKNVWVKVFLVQNVIDRLKGRMYGPYS